MVAYPREVFGWYESAQLHTVQRKIPKAAWVLLACVLAVPALGYVGWRSLSRLVGGSQPAPAAARVQASPGASVAVVSPARQVAAPERKVTVSDYLAERRPRAMVAPMQQMLSITSSGRSRYFGRWFRSAA